ncbi:hypothetical protein AOQ84DRAFT_321546, partial [Glonium stellatum]
MSIAVVSPRDLVLRHGKNTAKPVAPKDIQAKPDIGHGNQQLNSFYRPCLTAGSYSIDVRQDIAKKTDGTDPLDSKTSRKKFTVIAPQYFLPPGSINSVYPPNGHAAPHVTLPHVVLNDAQLPWERVGSEKELIGGGDALKKNRTPWLAVLVFTHDEIALSTDVISKLSDILRPLKPTEAVPKPIEATPTSAINVNIAELVAKISGNDTFSTPLTFNKDIDDPTNTLGDVVFLKKGLLQGLLRTYNEKGEADPAQSQHDVSRYRWLSHVRHVDTTGMAEAGSTTGLLGERDSLFSVVISHRTGPLKVEQPTPVIAHLVSIEGLEGMPYPFKTEYIALSSLHSWTYTSLPPNSMTVHHAFHVVGNSKALLRAPVTEDKLKALREQGKAGENVANRLVDGYSLARYRTQAGDLTAAFYRGPLTPTNVPYPLRSDWGDPSTHSTDRQIFDRQVGMMDISYSAAWQLGKTLALADRSFTVALARVRKQIQDAGVEEKKKDEMQKNTLFQTKIATVKSLVKTMKVLETLPHSDALLQSDVANRWQSQAPPRLDISFQALGEDEKKKLQDQLNRAAEKVSGTTDNPSVPYDEFNTPYSTDWMAVLKWILDRMYLAGIPPHYWISDPSHLPQETIRFFAIDRNWTDALIDGALSLANHLERSDDRVRRAIQHAIRQYLDTPSKGLKQKPPVPQFGFLLRSELVTKFPDMVITTDPVSSSKPEDDQQKPILIRHELLDTNVMLCLFDRPPDGQSFKSVTLGQPPHQQSFSIGSELNSTRLKIDIKGVYTGEVKDQPKGNDRTRGLPSDDLEWTKDETPTADRPPIFFWGSDDSDMRFMLTHNFANLLHGKVREGMNKDGAVKYAEPDPSASLVAYQLNDPNWQLKIVFQEDPKVIPVASLSTPPPEVAPRMVAKSDAIQQARIASMTAPKQPRPPKQTLLSTGEFVRSEPLRLDHPPPNAFVVPTTNSPSLPATDPEYKFRVFSLDSSTPDEFLKPSNTAQDLIFSITLTNNPASFELEYISILIPFSGIDDNNPERLMEDYRGSGGFMITNLRFNVVCSFIKEDAIKLGKRSLKIDLLPRTHRKRVLVSRCADLTFLLASVVVADVQVYKELKLPVTIKY